MTDAYVARDTRLERRVVLDVARRDASAREVARFVARARQLSTATHPSLAAVFDVGEHQGLPYCTSEHPTGELLADYAQAGSLLSLRKLAWIAQAASALAAAHAAGVAHGSVSLEALVVARDETVRLVFPLGRDATNLPAEDVRDLARAAVELLTGHDVPGERPAALAARLVAAGIPEDAASAIADARSGPPVRSADLGRALARHATFRAIGTQPLMLPIAEATAASLRGARGAIGSASPTLSVVRPLPARLKPAASAAPEPRAATPPEASNADATARSPTREGSKDLPATAREGPGPRAAVTTARDGSGAGGDPSGDRTARSATRSPGSQRPDTPRTPRLLGAPLADPIITTKSAVDRDVSEPPATIADPAFDATVPATPIAGGYGPPAAAHPQPYVPPSGASGSERASHAGSAPYPATPRESYPATPRESYPAPPREPYLAPPRESYPAPPRESHAGPGRPLHSTHEPRSAPGSAPATAITSATATGARPGMKASTKAAWAIVVLVLCSLAASAYVARPWLEEHLAPTPRPAVPSSGK